MIADAEMYDYGVIGKLGGCRGIVHSVFTRAVVLDVDGIMVTVVDSSKGWGPGFVTLSSHFACASLGVGVGEIGEVSDEGIFFGEMRGISFIRAVRRDSSINCLSDSLSGKLPLVKDLRISDNVDFVLTESGLLGPWSWGKVKGGGVSASFSLQEERYVLSMLRGLTLVLVSERFDEIPGFLSRIIGLGRGLTPACDDFLLGLIGTVTFIREIFFKGDNDPVIWVRDRISLIMDALTVLVPALLTRTTYISGSYLGYALAGRYTSIFFEMLSVVFFGDLNKKRRVFDSFLEYGASSSWYVLFGMLAGLFVSFTNPPGSLSLIFRDTSE